MFTITALPEGEVEFIAWAGGLSSNGVALTGVGLV